MDSAFHELLTFEAEYACFNSRRSLTRPNAGSARWTVRGDEVLIENEDWPENTYVNRVSTVSADLGRIESERPQFRRIDRFFRGETSDPSTESFQMKKFQSLEFLRHDLGGMNSGKAHATQIERCRDSVVFIGEVERLLEKEFDPGILRAKRAFYCTKNFRGYLARIDGVVAGLATLFIHERAGWLGNAFTDPSFRRRGVQLDLLRARIEDSRGLGLAFAYTDTPPDSESSRNAVRVGFKRVSRADTYESPNP